MAGGEGEVSACALEEVSVLSSIYCGHEEFHILHQSDEGLSVQINIHAGGDQGPVVALLFHVPPSYPSCPPQISVSSTALSKSQCQNIRKKLLERAAALPPQPMIHQLVQDFQQQYVQMMKESRDSVKEVHHEDLDHWVSVLLLDHIRSENRYVGRLRRWCQQLQITGTLLLGRTILVVLLGARADIKSFCQCLKTEKVDVDSSGKKCKDED
ncbi:RWD domain-containing protein 3 [Gouania willdenowi]|uniref:RWD domain-containing protein 3 n=1 Tax=Gouania willdenowi TaxID=441366 RepID=A0A8C5GLA1_GOUWI|nr:RWD domain-containing protein 3 [Gouania willdenowi]